MGSSELQRRDTVTNQCRLTALSSLPADALISAKELSFLAGRSRTSIWRDVKQNRLPRPISIGLQSKRWRVADVRAYLKGEGA
jgi:predicted DNA-binding transcriptional regulator AlpA